MLTRALISAALCGMAALTAASARPGDGWAFVECQESSNNAGCTTAAGTSRETKNATQSRSTREGRSSGRRGCADSSGNAVRCSIPAVGVMGGDGCYSTAVSGPPGLPVEALASGTSTGSGPWLLRTCQGESGWTTAWVPGGGGAQAVAAAPPSPVVVARQAVDRLVLPRPAIGVSPVAEQLVSLPTWLWIDGGMWSSRSATASVPGVSVTATAMPMKVTWSMGDGSSVECRGPGTPFRPGGDPKRESPDCGHTYRRSSAGQPGEAFTVTATISWAVSWAGNGEAGSLPGLETTATEAFRVAESQALVGSRGG
jgi:hypothetical protein